MITWQVDFVRVDLVIVNLVETDLVRIEPMKVSFRECLSHLVCAPFLADKALIYSAPAIPLLLYLYLPDYSGL